MSTARADPRIDEFMVALPDLLQGEDAVVQLHPGLGQDLLHPRHAHRVRRDDAVALGHQAHGGSKGVVGILGGWHGKRMTTGDREVNAITRAIGFAEPAF